MLNDLDSDEHIAILSQLMIMGNTRKENKRIKKAHSVIDSFLEMVEFNKIEVDTENASELIFHHAMLKKSYRSKWVKDVFKEMSRLFKRVEQEKTEPKFNKVINDLTCV